MSRINTFELLMFFFNQLLSTNGSAAFAEETKNKKSKENYEQNKLRKIRRSQAQSKTN